MYPDLFGSDLYISLILGVVLSLIYTEKTGILPAGLIVPGYIALVFDQPLFVALILFLSFLSHLIVMKGISRWVVLYGRRKFAAMIIVGIVLKLIFDFTSPVTYPLIPFEVQEFRGIGVIVPGLIANTIQKQGFFPTVGSTLLLSGITFLIMLLYHLI